jgi:hypothetical protein
MQAHPKLGHAHHTNGRHHREDGAVESLSMRRANAAGLNQGVNVSMMATPEKIVWAVATSSMALNLSRVAVKSDSTSRGA